MHHGMQILAITIQISNKGSESSFEVEGHLTVGALIHKTDRHAACHERHFAEALDESIKLVVNIFRKNLFIKLKCLLGAGLILYFADWLDAALWHTAFIVLLPELAIAFDLSGHPLGKGIHRADTHTMQTTRDLITAAAKLTACTDHGHDN